MLHPVRPVPEVRHSRDVAPPSSTERLHFLAHRFISRLAPEVVDDVTSSVATRGLPAIAAVCSGTDSPILCMDVVATEMRRRGVTTQPHHQFSCERDRHKRKCFQAVFPGATIFQDACELPQGRALLHDGSRAQVPPFNMLIAGFPCTSASLLNPRATTEANRTCVANAALATGSVFEALVQLLECQKGNASVAIFEHVTTLAQPHASQQASNLDAVVATLRSRCQMSLHVWQMDPHRDVGGPQLRPRLWMVAVKLELLQAGFLRGVGKRQTVQPDEQAGRITPNTFVRSAVCRELSFPRERKPQRLGKTPLRRGRPPHGHHGLRRMPANVSQTSKEACIWGCAMATTAL